VNRQSSGHDEIAIATSIVIVALRRVEHLCRGTHKVLLVEQGGSIGIVLLIQPRGRPEGRCLL
jgi:hypothetical protein